MDSPLPPDPYEALGVPKDAQVPTIRSAYRKLVLKCHPDKITDETLRAQKQEEFHLIQQSYEILNDEDRRRNYDAQVELAELQKEAIKRGFPTRVEVRRPAAPTTAYDTPTVHRVYEDRKTNRSYEEDIAASRYYQEPRASSRKYDEYERERSSKRSSARGYDDRRSTGSVVDEQERLRSERDYVKESERTKNSDRRRTKDKERDKERRRGHEDKYMRAAYVEEPEEISDDDYFRKDSERSKRRSEESRRSERRNDDTPRRESSRRKQDEPYEEKERKYTSHFSDARDYIERSRGAPTEIESRPSAPYRSSSSAVPYYDSRNMTPPATPPDTVRRSSARPREWIRDHSRSRSSVKDRDRRGGPEIVEPPKDFEKQRKMPSMPHSTSSPAAIKIPSTPAGRAPSNHRAATMQYVREPRHDDPPAMRRSETMPLNGMSSRRKDTTPSASSKLKTPMETHDSGYSSPGTPETQFLAPEPTPQPRSTRYVVVEDDHTDNIRGVRTVKIAPSDEYHRQRSVSPPPRRGSDQRPSLTRHTSSATKFPAPGRTPSYSYAPEASPSPAARPSPSISHAGSFRGPPPSPAIRSESFRGPPPLSRGESYRPPPPPLARAESRRPAAPSRMESSRNAAPLYGEVQYSPKIRPEDIKYGPGYGSRRGSEEAAKDSYYARYADPGRPGMGRRSETVAS
ncbi:MAG: hypothetical protein M1827_004842 [Pycnora praestabilis]|nr:MAG: hypothetical protein M1827_004842 [Pycnora praestabilis]